MAYRTGFRDRELTSEYFWNKSFDDIMTVMALLTKYRRRLRTTNGIEKLNKDISR